jgi:hypothetical protein
MNIQFRVGILVVVVRPECEDNAVQDGIGVGLHERRQGDKRIFDADARVVFIVLIENDASNAVGIGGSGEGSAVVEDEYNGVAENPAVVSIGQDVNVDDREDNLFERYWPGSQGDVESFGRRISETDALREGRSIAEIGIDFRGTGGGVPLVGKIVGNVVGIALRSGGRIASVLHEYVEDCVVVFVVVVGVEGDADTFEVRHGCYLLRCLGLC